MLDRPLAATAAARLRAALPLEPAARAVAGSVEMLLASQLGLLGLACLLYGSLQIRRHRAGEGSSAPRRLCFAAGAVTLAVAVIALGAPAGQLLYPEAVENLLIGDVGAMLIAVGLYRPASGSGAGTSWRALFDPRLALPLWAAMTFVWYLPGPHDAAVRSQPLHLLEHVLLLGGGVLAWSALLAIVHSPARLRVGTAVAYVLTWRVLQALLGAVGVWSENVYFHIYIHSEVTHAISPLADQGTAGAIVFGEAVLLALCVISWIYKRVSSGEAVLSPVARDLGSAVAKGAWGSEHAGESRARLPEWSP